MDGATIDFFPLPRSLLPPFPRVSIFLSSFPRSSNALIAAENRGLSQHERSMNPRPLMFSTFYLPLTHNFLSPSLTCCFLRYFCTRVCLLVSLLPSISFEIPLDQNRFTASSITLWIVDPKAQADVCISLGIINWHFFSFQSNRVNSNFFIISNFSAVAKRLWEKTLREESRKHDAKPRALSAFRGLGMYGWSRRKPR